MTAYKLSKADDITTRFMAGPRFWQALRIPAHPLHANLRWLQSKHPNEFKNTDAVMHHISMVLGKGDCIGPGSRKNSSVVMASQTRKSFVVEIVPKKDKLLGDFYLINSAYTLSPSQANRLKQAGGRSKSSPDANPVASPSGRLSPQSGSRGVLSKRFEDQRTNPKSTLQGKRPTTKPNPQKIGQRRTGADKAQAGLGKTQAMRNALHTSDTKGLARVWKMWTGTEPSKEIRLHLDKLGKTLLPASMVLLGTVCTLVGTDGTVKQWSKQTAPYLVTDATARRTWLLSEKPEAFDFQVAVISYLATKAKFGDTGATEYVHEFTRPARARMDGQTGTLTGSFQLTPKGIEG